jgi:hypothetical protein
MEHIPIPHSPLHLRPKVPVLSTDPYDGLQFETYPQRRGFDLARLYRGDFGQHSSDRTNAFLQTWLYFGVIHQVLGQDHGCRDLFITVEAGFENGIITTAMLEEMTSKRLLELRSALYDINPQTVQSAWKTYFDLRHCLHILLALATVHEDRRDFAARWPLSPTVDMSLRIMGHYLTSCLYPALMWVAPHDTTLFKFPVAYATIAAMCNASWCPSEITMITESFSPCACLFISELSRPSLKLDHSTCSNRLCNARQVQVDTYETKHVVQGCTCPHDGPNFNQIEAILQGGRFPLLTISQRKGSQTLTIDVEAYTGKQKYVAFSHVWSDGLGNPHHNTLPQCQIRRLKNLLDELASLSSFWQRLNLADFNRLYRKAKGQTLCFWLDTLCIPPPENQSDARLKALKLMKDTYEKSYEVIVLDGELQDQSLYRHSRMEAYVRISISGWMRRLWTLQEGVLGQRIFVRFQDGFHLVDVFGKKGAVPTSPESMRIQLQSSVATSVEVESLLMKMRFLRARIVEKKDFKIIGIVTKTKVEMNSETEARGKAAINSNAIFEAFKAAIYRSSSRKDDEFTCMASLLGWSIDGLRNQLIGDRMHYLLKQQQYLPAALIFLAGTRMKNQGWTWALDSFGSRAARQIDPNMPDNSEPGIVTKDGLLVKYPAIILPVSFQLTLHTDFVIWIDDESAPNNSGYVRIVRHQEFDANSASEIHPASSSRSTGLRQLSSHSDVSYLVLYHRHYDPLLQTVTTPAVTLSLSTIHTPGMIYQDGTKCKFSHLTRLEYLGSDENYTMNYLRRPDSRTMLIVERAIVIRQSWCIG